MGSEKQQIAAVLDGIASTVAHVMTEGTDNDRERLLWTLKNMDHDMPAVSDDTAQAKAFVQALIALLEGRPTGAEGLPEPYAGMFEAILGRASDARGPGKGAGLDTKEFLTQLAAVTVMLVRKGSDEDKTDFVKKLEEVKAGMAAGETGPASLVDALISIVKGRPVPASSLEEPYSDFYSKVLAETGFKIR